MLHLSVRQLIADRYSAVHGAQPSIDYPDYCTIVEPDGPLAALGYRRAADGPLFLESYLDVPVEAVLARRLGRRVDRSTVVEIGDHASARPQATLRLWAKAAELLAEEAELAVAVLTAPLRRMFGRVGVPVVEIAPALPEQVGSPTAWGRYYLSDPIVCVGEIEAGRGALEAWGDGLGLAA